MIIRNFPNAARTKHTELFPACTRHHRKTVLNCEDTMSKLKKNSWIETSVQFSSAQSLSCVRLFVTLWTAARQASLFITNSQSLLKLISI